MLGYGTGGKKHFENNIKKMDTIICTRITNAHNQFLQVLIDHGLLGFLILSFYTFIMIYNSIMKKNYLYHILKYHNIEFLNRIYFEHKRVIFFAFFNTILFFNWFNLKTLNT